MVGMRPLLATLKSLCLDLTEKRPYQAPSEQPRTAKQSQDSILAVCQFLGACKQLEHFELSWSNFKTVKTPLNVVLPEQNLLKYMHEWNQMPPLQSCALRGLLTTADTLLGFLRSQPHLRSVTLEWLRLGMDHYRDVFDCLTSELHNLKFIRLNSLYTISIVFFEDTDISCVFDKSGPYVSVTSRGEEVHQKISQESQHGLHTPGCEKLRNYIFQAEQTYGTLRFG